MGKGEETHLAEEFVVVREYAVDRLESRRLVEVFELQELRTLPNRQRSSKIANASHAAGPERLCPPVGKSDRFKLIGGQHGPIFL